MGNFEFAGEGILAKVANVAILAIIAIIAILATMATLGGLSEFFAGRWCGSSNLLDKTDIL